MAVHMFRMPNMGNLLATCLHAFHFAKTAERFERCASMPGHSHNVLLPLTML